MTEHLLPESIRGTWYLLSDKGSPQEALDADAQLLTLRIDGEFSRYAINDGQIEHTEDGDYTFDGSFLIVRGRNTDTFRVRVEADWHWFLEGKKKSRRLFRGMIEASDLVHLDDDELKEVRDMPMRVKVAPVFEHPTDTIYELTYKPKQGTETRVGWACVDPDPTTGTLWVGVTALAENIPAGAWEQIVGESFLKAFPGEAEQVSLEILGTGEVFDVLSE